MNTLISFFWLGWLLLLAVGGLGFWRLAAGPTVFDRIIGFDTLVVAVIGGIVLFSIEANTADYLELIIVVTALGFFTTVSFFYYLSQENSILKKPDERREK